MARERLTSRSSSRNNSPNSEPEDRSAQVDSIDELRLELRSHAIASQRTFQRQLIERVLEVLQTSPSPTLVINCVGLYFELLSNSASAYDHLCFDTCLCNMSNVLKSKHLQSCPVSDKKQFHAIWAALIKLVQSNTLNISDHSVAHIIVMAFVNILQHGDASISHHGVAGINCLLQSSSAQLFIVNILYKALLPLVLQCLSTPKRNTLVKVLVNVADRESHWLVSDHDASRTSTVSPQSDQPQLPFPILRFLQIVCIRAPEKAESRNSVADIVVQVLLTRDSTYIYRYQRFLLKACCHSRSSVRLLSLQTLASLFVQAGDDKRSMEEISTVLGTLHARVNDCVANVRAKALSFILDAFRSLPLHQCKEVLHTHAAETIQTLLSRTRDDKSRVRRNAVDLLSFICVQQITIDNDFQPMDIEGSRQLPEAKQSFDEGEPLAIVWLCENIKHRCSDASAVVRQGAVKHLTEILLTMASSAAQTHLQAVLRLWMDGVLPLMNDSDSRCQELCLDHINTVLTTGIGAERTSSKPTNSEKQLAELLLSEIGEEQEQRNELVRKALITMCKKNAMVKSQLDYLSGILKNEEEGSHELVRSGAWIVVEALSLSGKEKEVIRSVGKEVLVAEIVSKQNATACSTAANLSDVLDSTTKGALQAYCSKVLLPTKTIQDSWKNTEFIRTVAKLLGVLANEIGDELLEQCEAFIVEKENGFDERTTLALLHIIGSLCVSFRLKKTPPSAVVMFVEAMTSNVQTSSTQRAVAITTLGKLCLIDGFDECYAPSQRINVKSSKPDKSNMLGESLTRRLISIFVHELDNATSSATRNNAVVVLCDLCRHYTAIVQPFIPRLASLLMDSSEFVRVQVITSLVDLLQQDYIKIRTGPLFYHIALALLDSSNTVRSTAEYALLRIITFKTPSLLAVSFIELIFVLNDCSEGGTYNNFVQGSRRSYSPDMGLQHYKKRCSIYDVFLQGISLEHRLRLPGRLRTDIISNVLDEKLDFSKPCVEKVLEDVLNLLIVQPLNPFTRVWKSNDITVEDLVDEDPEKNQDGTSQKNLHSQTKKTALMKKVQECELRDALIPCLLELRFFLEKRRSPMIKNVMECLCTLLYPHRESLNTIIEDPVVRLEIEHQMLKGDDT
ncbi:condensin-2 complex subunit D3 isoform X1 [Gracilaria domingensis]|nr:condensin-2 complex subunit D3 isoform X1 [Gracilaria domingensis]